jgi:hypothetical protein
VLCAYCGGTGRLSAFAIVTTRGLNTPSRVRLMTSRNPSSPPRLSSSHTAETTSISLTLFLSLSLSPDFSLSLTHYISIRSLSSSLYLSERRPPTLLFDDGYKLRVWYGGYGYIIRSPNLDHRHRVRVYVFIHIYYIYIQINRGGIAERIKADA